MRQPVFRNLDKPFEVFGLTPLELMFLCLFFVLGGDLLEFLGLNRVWTFLGSFVLGFGMFWLRWSLGRFFLRRLVRFVFLPRELNPLILKGGGVGDLD